MTSTRLLFLHVQHFALRHLELLGLIVVAIASGIFLVHYALTRRRCRNREMLLRDIIGASRDALIITDTEGRVVEWNPAAEEMFRRTRIEALGRTPQELTALDPGDIPYNPSRPHTRSEAAVELMSRRSDGSEFPVEVLRATTGPTHAPQRVQFVRDISGGRSLRHQLAESEVQLRLATEMADIAIWRYDFVSNQMFRTENHDRLYGRQGQVRWDIETFLQTIHPEDRERSAAVIQASVAPGGIDVYSLDFRVIWPDGTLHWLWAKGEVIERDAQGQGVDVRGVLLDISERKSAEARLQRLTQLYAALSQSNQAIVRCTNEQELFPQICHDAVQFGGLRMAWIGMTDTDARLIRPVAASGAGVDYLKSIEISIEPDTPTGRGPTGTSVREERPVWCQDFQRDPTTAHWHQHGAQFGWRSSASLPLRRRGQTVGAFVVYSNVPDAFDEGSRNLLVEMAVDISFALDHFAGERERERAVEDLRASDLHLRTIIETEPECVKVLDRSGALIEMNSAGLSMLEVDSIDAARRHGLVEFVLPEHRAPFTALCQRVMNGENGTLEFEIVGAKGTHRWLETHVAPMRDAQGVVTSLIGVTRDVTELKRDERQIQYLANFDMLTGLPNRNLLADHVNYAIDLMQHGHESLCVMFVDLDRFKDINDTLGHSLGDELLIEMGKRLQSVLRKSDTVSRLGGDEFVLVLPDSGARAAAHVAEKLLKCISMPYHVGPYHLSVTASIGIAIYPHDGKDLESLSRSADTAMYQVKREGRNGYRFFTTEMQVRATRHMRLIHAMHRALEFEQFQLHYQPQIDIESGNVVGVEALLRWRHPEFGDVSPTEFIPIAEYSRLILPIGEWVLRTALRQLKSWLAHGHPPLFMAVNLSAVQFHYRNLPDLIRDILAEEQLSPSLLELELTESVAMHDPQGAIAVMDRLHEHGIRMSIDDFGTGFSSLNYLKKFKVRKVKIDQSFIREISANAEDRAIVSAIIGMSKSLSLQTIAEGVETAAQLTFLGEQGCDQAQGYYYCKPLPAAECEAFLTRR